MKNIFKPAALVLLAGVTGFAFADTAETKGGLKIKTDDGRFEMAIGGRMHLDGYLFDNDTSSGFGSTTSVAQGGLAFRRTYLTLTGKAYGWKYKFEHDFTAQSFSGTAVTPTCTSSAVPGGGGTPTITCAAITPAGSVAGTGFRELWVSTNLGPGEIILGQFKPFRGMEEMTSSNEITMIERPWTSATGIYNGRQFLMGAGYKGVYDDLLLYSAHAMSLGAVNTTTEGHSYGGRVAFFPLSGDGETVHLGLSYSEDREQNQGGTSIAISAVAPYAGRRGPSLTLGAVGNGTDASQTTMAYEIAGSFGPITLQAEYADSELENSNGAAAASDVTTYYLQISSFLTGETTSYKKDRGAFGKPKPAGEYGAWEFVARYDYAENDTENATTSICSTTGQAAAAAATTKCEVSTITTGVNWYVNPNVRFMLNYYVGEADLGIASGRKDMPKAATLRTQFSF